MDESGQILREAREQAGLSLVQMQEKTRINQRFLEALENGEYHELPSAVQVRGFLRNYARALALDPQPLLDRFDALESGSVVRSRSLWSEPSADRPIPARPDNPFFNPVNLEVNPVKKRAGGDSILRVIVFVALLVSIGLVASRFFVEDSRSFNLREALVQMLSDEPEADPATLDVEGMVEEGQDVSVVPWVETQRNQPEEQEARPSVLPTLAPLPDLEVIDLKLEITERTWLQVTVDGDVVFTGQATGGQVFEYSAAASLRLRSGNAKGVFVTINETLVIGRLGTVTGDVFDHTWTTTRFEGTP